MNCASLIAQSQARHPDVKIGLTGLPIMENDEMRSSQTSMFWASMISMVAVGILFVAGFGGAGMRCWPTASCWSAWRWLLAIRRWPWAI